MFEFLNNKKRVEKLEAETKKSFEAVKRDFESTSSWIKHLDTQDKQVFDLLSELKREIATVRDEIEGVKEAVSIAHLNQEQEQLSKKYAVLNRQTAVSSVQEPVQTVVQTGNFYDIFQGLSSNERLIIFTLMNSELKLSYEDLARLLGKERSTIRGQINSIKQKSEGLLQELIEPNGKKRVYISEEIKEKLSKYAKVRAGDKKKAKKLRDYQ